MKWPGWFEAARAFLCVEVSMGTHYDYEKQAWVTDGRYVECGHSQGMKCGCYGRKHAGEKEEDPPANAPLGGGVFEGCGGLNDA